MDYCEHRAPLKCWQFVKDSDAPVPRWALPVLTAQKDGSIEFYGLDGNGSSPMQDGDWLVELDDGEYFEAVIGHYTADEFRDQFQAIAPPVSA